MELTDRLRAIEDELLDPSEILRSGEAEVHVHIPERRPEIHPQIVEGVGRRSPSDKDRHVGSSRSVPPPRSTGPRTIEIGRPWPISSLGQSWLSSHHSDDDLDAGDPQSGV